MSGNIIQFPLARGLSEDDNAKSKPISSLDAGTNIRWVRAGTIGKRWGTEALPNFSGVRRFISRGSNLAVTDGKQLYTLDTRTGDEAWNTADQGSRVPEAALEWSTLMDPTYGVASSDVAIYGDLMIVAWSSGDPTREQEATPIPAEFDRTFVQISNWRTGQILLQPTPLGGLYGQTQVRVLISGTYAIVIYNTGTAGSPGTIEAKAIDLTSATFAMTNTQLADDLRFASVRTGLFDAIVLSNGKIALVYEEDATPVLFGKLFTRSGGTLTETLAQALYNSNIASIAIAEDVSAGLLYVLYCENYTGTTHRVRLLSVALTDLIPPAVYDGPNTLLDQYHAKHLSVFSHGSNVVTCAWSGFLAGTPNKSSLMSGMYTRGSVGSPDNERRSMTMDLTSRLFTLGDDNRLYAFAVDSIEANEDVFGSFNGRQTFPSSYLIEFEPDQQLGTGEKQPHRVVGKVDNDIASVHRGGLVPAVARPDSSADTVYALLPYQSEAAAEEFNWRSGLRLARATVDADEMADPWRSISLGPETYVSGGSMSAWDGVIVFDLGMRTPVIVNVAANTSAAGNLSNGNYIYQAGTSFHSSAGIIHRGPMSVQATVAISHASNRGADVTVATHGIDCKQFAIDNGGGVGGGRYGTTGHAPVLVDIFRSEANGSTAHKLSFQPRYNVLYNDPTEETVVLLDKVPDTDITANVDSPAVPAIALNSRPEPYTATGELEDVQPPAQYTMLYHNGRIFVVTGNRNEVWYTKDYREQPNIAPGFNPSFVEIYDQKVTALASMDEKRLVFWERGIWFVVGDGPTAGGTDNRFTPPQVIQTDVGCTNPRSVVSFPGGVAYQCGTDLYLIDRGLQVSWFGKDVREKLATYSTITSAVLVSADNEIRFTCNSDTDGIVLAYDYLRNTWMVREYSEVDPIMDATLHDGSYYFATATKVFREDRTTHLDDGAYVNTSVRVSAISPAGGPMSWQRVKAASLIGESVSNHQLTMSIKRDFSTSTQQTKSFAAGSDVTTVGTLEQARIDLAVQKVQSVTIQIDDAAPANANAYPLGNGAGFTLEGISLLVKPKSGTPRLSANKRG